MAIKLSSLKTDEQIHEALISYGENEEGLSLLSSYQKRLLYDEYNDHGEEEFND